MPNSFIKNGVEYYQMFIGCPVCTMYGRPTTPTQWYHCEDGGEMYIGDNGYYYCIDCKKTMPIIDWAYVCSDCENAGHEKAVKIDNLKHVAETISVSGLVTSVAGMEWLVRITNALIKQQDTHS